MAKNQIKNFYSGFSFIRSGYKLIKSDKKLKRLALIPLMIDMVLFVACLFYGGGLIAEWATTAITFIVSPESTFLFGVLYYPLLIIFWLAFVVVAVYLVYFLGSIIAAPFNSLLAEAALHKLGVIQEKPFSVKSWVTLTIKMTVISVVKAVVLGGVGLIIFVASFIPGINAVVAFIAFQIMAFDIMDYSFEIKEMTLKERFRYFKKHIDSISGMAAAIGLTMFIPGLTFLLLPCAVVGSAQVINNIENHNLLNKSV